MKARSQSFLCILSISWQLVLPASYTNEALILKRIHFPKTASAAYNGSLNGINWSVQDLNNFLLSIVPVQVSEEREIDLFIPLHPDTEHFGFGK